MFTIKYRMTDGAEVIEGGFHAVSASIEECLPRPDLPEDHPDNVMKAYKQVVVGHRLDSTKMQFGPVTVISDHAPGVEPVVFVMNEGGATVAKYSLL